MVVVVSVVVVEDTDLAAVVAEWHNGAATVLLLVGIALVPLLLPVDNLLFLAVAIFVLGTGYTRVPLLRKTPQLFVVLDRHWDRVTYSFSLSLSIFLFRFMWVFALGKSFLREGKTGSQLDKQSKF